MSLQVLKALASTLKTLPHDQLNTSLDALLETVVSQFINLDFPSTESTSQADHVFEYAKETLSIGMLMFEFKDAIKEGGGRRVLHCWKYFFLFFRSTGHKNYCIEALNLLAQYYYTLPP